MKLAFKLSPIVLLLVVSPLWADIPYLLVAIHHNKYLRTMTITAIEESNRELPGNKLPLDDGSIDDLEKTGVFFGKKQGNTVEKIYNFLDDEIRVVMKFPRKQTGRRMNDSTRVELSLYIEDKQVFSSKYFGQHSDFATHLPESGLKFKPFFMQIHNNLEEDYFIDICGIYAARDYSKKNHESFTLTPSTKKRDCLGFTLNDNGIINDIKMTQEALVNEAKYKKIICNTQE
jgi:hypothetical protein